MTIDEELPPSRLGTQAHWDEVYEWVHVLYNPLQHGSGANRVHRREVRVFKVSCPRYVSASGMDG